MRIFVDMDGTLAEWNNVEYEQLFEKGYYAGLKPDRVMEEVRMLAKTGAPVYILSCYLTNSEYALSEKEEWLDKWLPEIPPERRIFVPDGKNKAEYLKENYSPINKEDVLVDDYTKNLTEWESYGGTGIKYLNGINHTKGTWQGLKADSMHPSSGLINTLDKAIETFSYDNDFSREIDRTLIGTFDVHSALKVCDTPQILLDVGCMQLPMLYTQNHLRSAIKEKNMRKHQHGLTIEEIKMLPELLKDPVMIFDSVSNAANDSIVAVTDKKNRYGEPIFAVIKPNGRGKYEITKVSSNFITSVYGKDIIKRGLENTINKAVYSNRMLYINKQKSQEMFSISGLQLPRALTGFPDFDTIIHKSRNIVNTQSEKILKEKKPAAKKQGISR